jgi:hypothetical protein
MSVMRGNPRAIVNGRVTIPTPVTVGGNAFTREFERGIKGKLIGVRWPDLVHLSDTSAGAAESPLTETIFDTTTRLDSAHVLLTNSSGDSVTLRSVIITASKVIEKNSLVHDAFIDRDDIARNGEAVMRFGGDDVTDPTHLALIAEHRWKSFNKERHIYTFQVPGTWHWMTPGERYQLQAGGAGKAEYIDSFVVCARVQTVLGRSIQTLLVLYEAEEAFKQDSTALTRYYATGRTSTIIGKNRIVIGTKYSDAPADIRVDGIADDVEINQAISLLHAIRGGGIIHFNQGVFVITSAITLFDNITLEGEGASTILDIDTSDYGIEAVGGIGSELTNITIRNLQIQSNASDSSSYHIYLESIDNSVIENVACIDPNSNGIEIFSCHQITIRTCQITDIGLNYAIDMNGSQRCTLDDIYIDFSNSSLAGVACGINGGGEENHLSNIIAQNIASTGNDAMGIRYASDNGLFTNIKITTIDCSDNGHYAYGILLAGAGNRLTTMHIDDVTHTGTAAQGSGIEFQSADNSGLFNSLIENCSGTSIVLDSGSDHNQVIGNRLTGNGTDTPSDSGAGNTIANNDAT